MPFSTCYGKAEFIRISQTLICILTNKIPKLPSLARMKNGLLFSAIGMLVLVFGCKQQNSLAELTEPTSFLYDSALSPFYHGVASGDPLADRVIIWTRVTPTTAVPKVTVTWQVATDPDFQALYATDTTSTGPDKDYTVKVDVSGLKPGQTYFYRFQALGIYSAVGKTKTLPIDNPQNISLAVVSCSNWEFGYFNAYAAMAKEPIDAVVHLGDYIYEYQQGGYGDTTLNRKHIPEREIVSLQDYRLRYAQYHLDAGLREARRQIPFICIWDDHEVANNVYMKGAQNHQPDEGDFESRKKVARQAYYEWLPIRESKEHYRSFTYGNLLDLIMLDERLAGRTKPADSLADPTLASEKQTMLGEEQLQWLKQNLTNSKAQWKIIGNQVIFAEIEQSKVFPKAPKNLDSWDGYPFEQKNIRDFIKNTPIANVVFVTGDTHASWAIKIQDEKNKTLAVELGTTSISSSNWNEYESDSAVIEKEKILMGQNPHIVYGNARDHGYLYVRISANNIEAEWRYVKTNKEINAETYTGKKILLEPKTLKLTEIAR
ncbi:MAG: alkaline phosphatase D family protein [Cyclobacteriaceae bacterium]|jgi:alkaline phosphatase D|nr:alkaline phosphatase D family protein [Cyclobacteriaceae bacterium]